MNDTVQSIINPMGIVVYLTIGLLIFVSIRRTLSKIPQFSGRICIAAAVTILCLLGIAGFLGNPAMLLGGKSAPSADTMDHDRDFGIVFLFIPYAALGLSMLAMPLLISVDRLFRNIPKDSPDNQPIQNTLHEKSQQPNHIRQPENNSKRGWGEDDGQDDDSPGRWVP